MFIFDPKKVSKAYLAKRDQVAAAAQLKYIICILKCETRWYLEKEKNDESNCNK